MKIKKTKKTQQKSMKNSWKIRWAFVSWECCLLLLRLSSTESRERAWSKTEISGAQLYLSDALISAKRHIKQQNKQEELIFETLETIQDSQNLKLFQSSKWIFQVKNHVSISWIFLKIQRRVSTLFATSRTIEAATKRPNVVAFYQILFEWAILCKKVLSDVI